MQSWIQQPGHRRQDRDQGCVGRPRGQPRALMAGHRPGPTGQAGITDQPAPWLPSVDRAHTPQSHAHTPSLQQIVCSQARPLGQPRALPRRAVNTLQATCSKLTTPTRTPACTWDYVYTEQILLRNQDSRRRRRRHSLGEWLGLRGSPLGQNARRGGMGPLPTPTKARSRWGSVFCDLTDRRMGKKKAASRALL